MPKSKIIYPSFNKEHLTISVKSAATRHGFPEPVEPETSEGHYPTYPGPGFAEGIVKFLRHVLHRK
jgi:hypothetical protein